MRAADLEIEGIVVGHVTNVDAQTGCTVVRFPEGTVASGEVRGGAPATREFELLSPQRMVARLDALVLTGGSVFGLAAADGTVAALAEEGIGFPTAAGPVPIVVAMALFDLRRGDGSARPTAADGFRATTDAGPQFEVGPIGAGTGASIGKWGLADPALAPAGGIGVASATRGDLVVSALMAVNAAGHIDDGTWNEAVMTGTAAWPSEGSAFENTTIGLVVTNAKLSKQDCHLVAQGAHDGLARALFPPHTSSDGDAVVAAATGAVEAQLDVVRALAVVATETAIRNSVA